jgi:hypothetical protein
VLQALVSRLPIQFGLDALSFKLEKVDKENINLDFGTFIDSLIESQKVSDEGKVLLTFTSTAAVSATQGLMTTTAVFLAATRFLIAIAGATATATVAWRWNHCVLDSAIWPVPLGWTSV